MYWNDGNREWISISDISGSKYISNTKEKITEKAIQDSGIKKIPANTVIMSFKLSIGKVAITSKEMYSNEAIMAFIDKKRVKLLPEYVYYLLMGVKWDQNTNKAVMGKTLNKSTISQIIVDVDDYEIQKQKAEALDSASKQLDIRNKEIQKLDTLVKARFVEMFGDPVKNTKEFGLTKLSDLGLLERGKSKHRPRNDPALLGGPYPLIQTGEVTNSGVYIKDYSSTYSDLGLAQSHMWPKGTLCITIAANIAQTAILNFDACFPDSVVGFISNDNSISTIYLHYWFTFFQKILDAQAPQVAQKNINLKILSNLKVIVPPLLLQQEFSSFVQQVDKSKVA
jgi:type I restriction enzyme S subunit